MLLPMLWWRYISQTKTLEKQKKGKKRMRQVGNVENRKKLFMAVLKLNDYKINNL
jgi:translation elongation factor EF-4